MVYKFWFHILPKFFLLTSDIVPIVPFTMNRYAGKITFAKSHIVVDKIASIEAEAIIIHCRESSDHGSLYALTIVGTEANASAIIENIIASTGWLVSCQDIIAITAKPKQDHSSHPYFLYPYPIKHNTNIADVPIRSPIRNTTDQDAPALI